MINAYVFSKRYYYSSVWSSTSACNIRKLLYVQNFAARTICNVKKYDHISLVLRNLRWLPVKTQLYCRDATLTFKCMTDQAPEYLTSMYITRGSVSGRINRNFQRLNIPLCKTATGKKTFCYKSVSIWNKLDPSLKLCKSSASFKRALKKIPFCMNFKLTIFYLKTYNSYYIVCILICNPISLLKSGRWGCVQYVYVNVSLLFPV